MKRFATPRFIIGFLLIAGCSSPARDIPDATVPTPPTSAVAVTTTAAPPPTTAAIPLRAIAAPHGRRAPVPPATAQQAADYLVRAEQGLLSTAAPTELAEFGHLQQVAYRTLAAKPEWDSPVIALLPAALVPEVKANLQARRAFFAIKSGFGNTVPAWQIVEPEPAERLLAYFEEAERATGIGWHYLAAINFIETGFGRIRGLSTAGAQGPMQFIPSTWNEAGIGKGDINDPHDAIQAAARYLVRRGGPADMRKALFGYNNSNAYVEGIVQYAELIKADRSNFVALYHWEIYFSTERGELWFPAGVYREPVRISIDEYVAKAPWSLN